MSGFDNHTDWPPVEWPVDEDPYRYGACSRCLTPKPYEGANDLCACCNIALDRILGLTTSQ